MCVDKLKHQLSEDDITCSSENHHRNPSMERSRKPNISVSPLNQMNIQLEEGRKSGCLYIPDVVLIVKGYISI